VTAPPSPACAPPRLAPRLAERYDVFDEIGRGGASVVYLARERATARAVAIKLVGSAAGDGKALARFAREARIAEALQHANIVRTLEAEEWEGVAAFVTEYADGGTLRAALRAALDTGEPWPYARVAAVLRDVAAALAHAHAARVVHRDVKPENVFLDAASGRAMLADFGIAVELGRPGSAASGGEAAGTPSYMAPEQVAGRPVDERTDVYALGLVGWELLAGRRPWEGEPLHAVLHRQQHEALPPLAALRPDIPAYLLAAVEGALAKPPHDRCGTGRSSCAGSRPRRSGCRRSSAPT
jgi:serine/threonine protein kinase